MNVRRVPATVLAVVLARMILPAAAPADEVRTRNVILVTLDGVRTQEIFGGLDETIAEHDARQIYSDIAAMRERFGAATPQARRETLLPSFWKTLAPEGMVFGSAAHGNHLQAENRVLWSAPGYAEMLTGRARPDIVDNTERRYPYRTALEFAREALGLDFAEVAQIGSSDTYSLAAASRDDAFLMIGTYDALPPRYSTPELDRLAHLRREVMGLWDEGSNDALTFRLALGFLERHRPRFLWLALVNSDDWAHADRYDRYLAYLHRTDALLGELWVKLQSMKRYRDCTTLVVTTDHGRGLGAKDWREHDITIPGSEALWLAVIGPDTPDLGEVTTPGTFRQGQVAATLLQFLGLDFRDFVADALPPITGVMGEAAPGLLSSGNSDSAPESR